LQFETVVKAAGVEKNDGFAVQIVLFLFQDFGDFRVKGKKWCLKS